jgi:Fur family ferric uptake transcriptional regulator
MSKGFPARDWKTRLTDHIREHGGRVTGPRMKVAEVFFGMKGHPGVEELAAEVHKRHQGIGNATIYRTMKLLCEAGLVRAGDFGNGFSRYEPVLPRAHHDHLICTGCGRIVDFEDHTIEALQETVSLTHGFRMDDHKLEIYGLCSRCQAKGSRPQGRPRPTRGGSRPRRI